MRVARNVAASRIGGAGACRAAAVTVVGRGPLAIVAADIIVADIIAATIVAATIAAATGVGVCIGSARCVPGWPISCWVTKSAYRLSARRVAASWLGAARHSVITGLRGRTGHVGPRLELTFAVSIGTVLTVAVRVRGSLTSAVPSTAVRATAVLACIRLSTAVLSAAMLIPGSLSTAIPSTAVLIPGSLTATILTAAVLIPGSLSAAVLSAAVLTAAVGQCGLSRRGPHVRRLSRGDRRAIGNSDSVAGRDAIEQRRIAGRILAGDRSKDLFAAGGRNDVSRPAGDIVFLPQVRHIADFDLHGNVIGVDCSRDVLSREDVTFNTATGRAIVVPEVQEDEPLLAGGHLLGFLHVGDPSDGIPSGNGAGPQSRREHPSGQN